MRPSENRDLYSGSFVRGLFDEMSATYGRTNLLSSLGFCLRWRRQCVDAIRVEPHGIYVEIPVWYVLAVDIDKASPRMFRMDRSANPRPFGRRFLPSMAVVADMMGDVPHGPLGSGLG